MSLRFVCQEQEKDWSLEQITFLNFTFVGLLVMFSSVQSLISVVFQYFIVKSS